MRTRTIVSEPDELIYTLQHTATHAEDDVLCLGIPREYIDFAAHSKTLQQNCNTLQYPPSPQHTSPPHSSTSHCGTLQHSATSHTHADLAIPPVTPPPTHTHTLDTNVTPRELAPATQDAREEHVGRLPKCHEHVGRACWKATPSSSCTLGLCLCVVARARTLVWV